MNDVSKKPSSHQMNNFAAIGPPQNAQTKLSASRILKKSGQLLARRGLDCESGLTSSNSSSSGPDFSARNAFGQALHPREVGLTSGRRQLVEALHLHLVACA